MNYRAIGFALIAIAFVVLMIILAYIGIHSLANDSEMKALLNTPLYKVPFGYGLTGLFFVLVFASHFFKTEVTCCECGEDMEEDEEEEAE